MLDPGVSFSYPFERTIDQHIRIFVTKIRQVIRIREEGSGGVTTPGDEQQNFAVEQEEFG
jgi:hypothetical protein